MSTVRDTLNAALKEAMVAKDNARRDLIRLIQSAIKQVEIDTRKEVTDDEALVVIQKEAKKRREAIEEADKANRADIADAERAELALIESFLPRQLSLDEVKAVAAEIIAEVGATSTKDTGKVMGPLMARLKGQADGKTVGQAVRELLNA
ncbi:MAG: GatB/YqeY domain-containing protein [Anaerolineae bacterium]|jgi:hypothetical protein|nr:GatB/YqeY domain-containing protein [Anaerolineae bacterium]